MTDAGPDREQGRALRQSHSATTGLARQQASTVWEELDPPCVRNADPLVVRPGAGSWGIKLTIGCHEEDSVASLSVPS